MQLRLAHRALQTEKEAVVVKSRVIHAVRVGKERVEHGADLEKLVPVPARSCQAGHLDTEHQTDPAEPDFGNQTLKARVHCGRGAGAPEIIIDHHHPLTAPAKLEGTVDETVLQPGRLLMPLDLLRSCPRWWCKSAGSLWVSGGFGRLCHAATAGSLTKGSSLNGAIVSRVM